MFLITLPLIPLAIAPASGAKACQNEIGAWGCQEQEAAGSETPDCPQKKHEAGWGQEVVETHVTFVTWNANEVEQT